MCQDLQEACSFCAWWELASFGIDSKLLQCRGESLYLSRVFFLLLLVPLSLPHRIGVVGVDSANPSSGWLLQLDGLHFVPDRHDLAKGVSGLAVCDELWKGPQGGSWGVKSVFPKEARNVHQSGLTGGGVANEWSAEGASKYPAARLRPSLA